MKFFKKDDGVVEILAKLTTIAGVLFGAWAYYHTIHPVFEKEMELQNLRGEAQGLTTEIGELNTSLVTLQQEKMSLLNSVALFQGQLEEIRAEIGNKEIQLHEVTANFENAADAAVLNKLQYYSNKLHSAHLLAAATGNEDSFNVLSLSQELLATHVPDEEDKYAQIAYEYFGKYVDEHSREEIKWDEATEFAVSLFFDYKIDLLRRRLADGQ
ncbi:hypothetical protein [Vreelandella populi]|uniref:Uncharacterized protein n=1 Tax=Vreelandella populi TaxID=2498858 RepID=A0A433LCX1_9GAMM|nr:hypothetical protein [Halomonas populi]RUR46548.1 hypothetical protein ELY37_11355 [Halomonas populi]